MVDIGMGNLFPAVYGNFFNITQYISSCRTNFLCVLKLNIIGLSVLNLLQLKECLVF